MNLGGPTNLIKLKPQQMIRPTCSRVTAVSIIKNALELAWKKNTCQKKTLSFFSPTGKPPENCGQSCVFFFKAPLVIQPTLQLQPPVLLWCSWRIRKYTDGCAPFIALSFSVYHVYPWDPCMVYIYIPTFGWFFMVNVGKYTIHGPYMGLKVLRKPSW